MAHAKHAARPTCSTDCYLLQGRLLATTCDCALKACVTVIYHCGTAKVRRTSSAQTLLPKPCCSLITPGPPHLLCCGVLPGRHPLHHSAPGGRAVPSAHVRRGAGPVDGRRHGGHCRGLPQPGDNPVDVKYVGTSTTVCASHDLQTPQRAMYFVAWAKLAARRCGAPLWLLKEWQTLRCINSRAARSADWLADDMDGHGQLVW